MGNSTSAGSFDDVHAYYCPNDDLITFTPPVKHSPTREFVFVSEQDQNTFYIGDECYLVHALWLNAWLGFAQKKTKTAPGPINNIRLLDEETGQLLPKLKPKTDYRPVSKKVWEYLFVLYGGGPVITFQVPSGFTEEMYEKGSWIKKVDLLHLVTIIAPCSDPQPTSYHDSSLCTPASLRDSEAALTSTAVHTILDDVGLRKIREAEQEVQQQLSQETGQAIGGLLAKDLGRARLRQASALESNAIEAVAGGAATVFASTLAESTFESAKHSIAASTTTSIGQEASLIWMKQGAKQRFLLSKAALSSSSSEGGINNTAALSDKERQQLEHNLQEAAASMLVSAWRGKLAHKRVQALKQQKQQLLEDGYARKLQSRYRIRLARKRVLAIRQQQRSLREEGAAILLQCNWRTRQARSKIAILKKKKQKLLEGGCALRLQSRWRIRHAKGKVETLRDQKRLKKECASVVKLQHLWRLKLAQSEYARRLRNVPRVLCVEVKGAMGINAADINSSDPYVLLHVQSIQDTTTTTTTTAASAMSTATNELVGEFPKRLPQFSDQALKESETVGLYRTRTIANSLNPTWNETCLVANVYTARCSLGLTLMDSDTFHADDFLGQTMLSMERFPELISERTINLSSLPINAYKCPVHNASGKGILPNKGLEEVKAQGFYFISLKLCPLATSHAGWVLKQPSSLLGFGITNGGINFKSRFMILAEGKIQYFDDAHSLNSPRSTIVCANISEFGYGGDQHGTMTLHIKSAEDEWYLRFPPETTKQDIQTWLRKIQYNCPKIVTLNDEKGCLTDRIENILKPFNKLRRRSSGKAHIEVKSTPNLKRRASTLLNSLKESGSATKSPPHPT